MVVVTVGNSGIVRDTEREGGKGVWVVVSVRFRFYYINILIVKGVTPALVPVLLSRCKNVLGERNFCAI